MPYRSSPVSSYPEPWSSSPARLAGQEEVYSPITAEPDSDAGTGDVEDISVARYKTATGIASAAVAPGIVKVKEVEWDDNDTGREDTEDTEEEDWSEWFQDGTGEILPLPSRSGSGYLVQPPALQKIQGEEESGGLDMDVHENMDGGGGGGGGRRRDELISKKDLRRNKGKKRVLPGNEDENPDTDNENETVPTSKRLKRAFSIPLNNVPSKSQNLRNQETHQPQTPFQKQGIRMLISGIPLFIKNPFSTTELSHLRSEIISRNLKPLQTSRKSSQTSKMTSKHVTRRNSRRKTLGTTEQLEGLPIAPAGPRFPVFEEPGRDEMGQTQEVIEVMEGEENEEGKWDVWALERAEREEFDKAWLGTCIIPLYNDGSTPLPPQTHLLNTTYSKTKPTNQNQVLHSAGYLFPPPSRSPPPHHDISTSSLQAWTTATQSHKVQTCQKEISFCSLRAKQILRRAERIEALKERLVGLVQDVPGKMRKEREIGEVVMWLRERARVMKVVGKGWEDLEGVVRMMGMERERQVLRRFCDAWRGV